MKTSIHKVRVPKGTEIFSTRPGQSKATAKRTYTVTVDHMLPERAFMVGYRKYDADGNLTHEDNPKLHHDDLWTVERIHGTRDLESLREHFYEGEPNVRPDGTSFTCVFLRVEEPMVSWAGRGGYWNRARLSQVKIVEETTAVRA